MATTSLKRGKMPGKFLILLETEICTVANQGIIYCVVFMTHLRMLLPVSATDSSISFVAPDMENNVRNMQTNKSIEKT